MTEADDPTPAKRAIPALMRTAEVKEYFDVSDRTLRRWEDNGYLVPRRIGSTLFYRWEDIQAALDAEIDQDIKILIKKTAATKSKQKTTAPERRKSLK